MIKRFTLLLLLFFSCGSLFSQNNATNSCGQKELMRQLYAKYPQYKQINDQIEKLLSDRNKQILAGKLLPQRPTAIVTLPVVVHIIHNNGAENISDAQVLSGIQHLNEAFANTGYYDPADGVNTQIQFCMAQRDPANNPTNGITRDVSAYTVMGGANYYSDDQNVKNINRWDPHCYINIWLVRSIPTSVVGYAYLPSAHGSNLDGIVEEAGYFGNSYSNDVVIIHEMGHFLGLYHTFEGACTNNDCVTDGDKVCDTPPDQSTAGISCTSTVNSCTTDTQSGFSTDQNDLTQDYMDYGNFNCMKVFTQGQADRMNWFIQNVRMSLLNCKSCMIPCPAPVIANFVTTGPPFIAGSSYLFTNTSVNAASYQWYVNGVLQSTAVNFNYLFSAVGSYTIKLIAKSGNPLCDDVIKSITINAICGVTSGFTKSAAVAACGTNINFTNTSAGATTYEWYVNSVLQSTATNFFYTAAVAGQYFIKLIAKNNIANCQQEYTDTVNYTCSVLANFTPLSGTTIINTPVTFNSTGAGATTYQWLINGIVAGSGPSFTYTFTAIGSYSIQLIAGNGTCSATKYGIAYITDVCGNAAYLFQKTYAAGLTSGANDIKATADGGSIVAERIITTGNSNPDAAILKLDAGGNVQWMNTYSNNIGSEFKKIRTTLDGGYIAIGSTSSGPGGTNRVFIVKTIASGAIGWSREIFPGDGGDVKGTNIIQSVDGTYYFTGIILPPGTINSLSDALVGKLDATGNIIWIKTYDTRSSEQALSLAEDNSRLIVCGNQQGQIGSSGFLLKLSKADGAAVWAKTYQSVDENFSDVMVVANGYYINAMRKVAVNGLFTDHMYIKTDSNGNILYSKYIRPFGTAKQTGWAASFTKSNGNIVSVTTAEFGGTYQDFLLQEINTTSGIVFTKKYNRNNTWMNALNIAADNGLWLAGFSQETTTPPIQTYVMKLDSVGNAGSCPSEDTPVELLPAQYITAVADFYAKNIQAQIVSNHVPYNVNVTAAGVCQYITCDSVPLPPDTCVLCNTLKLSGQDTVCNLVDTINFTGIKNSLCPLPVQWQIDTVFAQIISFTDSSIAIKFKKTGAVKLYGKIITSCGIITDSLLINIFDSPGLIDLGPDIQLCKLSTIKLNAGAGFKTYLWNDGSVDSVLTAYNVGQYFVVAEDHCKNKYYDTINITQAPDISFDLGPDLKKCNNDTLTITAPGSFLKYTWSGNYNINTTNGKTVKVWPVADTSYTVIAEVAKGCTVVDTIRIKVNRSLPVNIGNDTSFCIGEQVIFKAPNGFVNYVWQDASAGQSFTATQTGFYWVRATDVNGCISKDTAEVKQLFALPVISLGNDIEICVNEKHVFTAGNGFVSYLWQDNSLNATFTTSQIGKYWVQVTNANKCKNADTVSITGYKPVPQNFLQASAVICIGRSNEIKSSGIWNSYLWSTNAFTSSIKIINAGDYWLQVTNSAGCSARDTILVKGTICPNNIYFPNAFTPGNDGKNDLYKPAVDGVLQKMQLTIYNRYGEKVFESSDPLKGWNGFYNGKLQDTGTFAWYCNYQFTGEILKTEKGFVVLIR